VRWQWERHSGGGGGSGGESLVVGVVVTRVEQWLWWCLWCGGGAGNGDGAVVLVLGATVVVVIHGEARPCAVCTAVSVPGRPPPFFRRASHITPDKHYHQALDKRHTVKRTFTVHGVIVSYSPCVMAFYTRRRCRYVCFILHRVPRTRGDFTDSSCVCTSPEAV
jgi:hypothetical protein